MKSFALFCFLLLASACVFVARAEEEAAAVDSAKLEDTPHALEQADEEQADEEQADEEQADEEKTQADEEETEAEEEKEEADEEETEADEEETEADETENDEEAEEDEEETTDLADDEPEKRGFGWVCKRYARKGYSYCKKCGCSYRCKRCTRRYCKKYQCGTRKICKTYYKTLKYKQILPNNYWNRRYKGGYKGGYKGSVGYNGGHGGLGGYKGGHRGRIGYNGGHGGLGGYNGGHGGLGGYKGGHGGLGGYNGGHGGLGGYKGGYRPRYVWKTRKVPYVKCKHYAKYCKKCYKKSYKCHCGTKCRFNKCYRPTTYTPHYG